MSDPKARTRPWASYVEAGDGDADFIAWGDWLRREPSILSDCSVEFIEQCQGETSLYILMCDLADGSGEDG